MPVFKGYDLIGLKVNKIKVLAYIGSSFYACVCDCGNFCKSRSGALRRGDKVSCGCTNRGQGSTLYSKEKFIELAILKHQHKYDYTKVEYVNSTTDVFIGCLDHGWFKQTPNSHLTGSGCPACGVEKSKIVRRKSFKEFMEQADSLHGGKYDYTEAKFADSTTKISILCKICNNVFMQSPNSHLRGNGCAVCAGRIKSHKTRSTLELFAEKALNVHGQSYDYSKVSYTRSNCKVEIVCKTCNQSFFQKPNHHLSGRGCPNCAVCGFKPSKKASLYVLHSDNITKVGITNTTPSERARMVSLSCGKDFIVADTHKFESGEICQKVEFKLLKELKARYNSPLNKFHGYSECFLNVDRDWLCSTIDRIKEEYDN